MKTSYDKSPCLGLFPGYSEISVVLTKSELYPMLLLEEVDLIIFKVCILVDALCFFSPGWNLK